MLVSFSTAFVLAPDSKRLSTKFQAAISINFTPENEGVGYTF